MRTLETIRAFGLEQLAACGELEAARDRHTSYFVRLAEQAEPRLSCAEQPAWIARLAYEQENVRTATSWSRRRGDVESVVRINAALALYWRARGDAATAREHVHDALALALTAHLPQLPASVKALVSAGDLARTLGEYDAADAMLRSATGAGRRTARPRARCCHPGAG